jgi:hypothetical protein
MHPVAMSIKVFVFYLADGGRRGKVKIQVLVLFGLGALVRVRSPVLSANALGVRPSRWAEPLYRHLGQ